MLQNFVFSDLTNFIGVICLGYPLVGQKGDLRDEILTQLTVPILFVQGVSQFFVFGSSSNSLSFINQKKSLEIKHIVDSIALFLNLISINHQTIHSVLQKFCE
jgi:predicted alpha/beta-hydrolase family hydrolase